MGFTVEEIFTPADIHDIEGLVLSQEGQETHQKMRYPNRKRDGRTDRLTDLPYSK